MTTVVIEGLGLIGGSLALAIKEGVPDAYLIGLDQQPATLTYAKAHGLIDEIGSDLATVAPQADFIILATPVVYINRSLQTLTQVTLKPNVIVTDTGSTKQQVMTAAQPLLAQGVTVIGGHPMAGSHKSGVQAANIDLFRSAYYFIVPANERQAAASQRLEQLLAPTQAKFLTVAPAEHDQIVGMLSHVPHILSAALVNETRIQFRDSPAALRLAAGGFKDMTRIASSDPEMWADILLTNQSIILGQLKSYQQRIQTLMTRVNAGDHDALLDFFHQAKVTRDSIQPKQTGAIPGFHDLFVNIPDHTGAIAKVTSLLAQAEIQIVNIQILETREDINGILQLTFASASDKQRATVALENGNVTITQK